MPPQTQPSPTPPPLMQQPNNPNPYDFIFEQKNTKRRSVLNGKSQKARLLIVIGGIVLLLIIGLIISSLLGGGTTATTQLESVVSQQQEIIRIAELCTKNGKTQNVINFCYTTDLTIKSDQKIIIGRLAKQKIKLNVKQLAASHSAQTDVLLTQAGQNNNYDSVIIQVLHEKITSYQTTLHATYALVNNLTTKKVLSDAFNSSVTLLAKDTTQSN
ncbi:MAG: hypothetical protein NVSMB46_00500 [Candidatus Saccharimonadales bacterium]